MIATAHNATIEQLRSSPPPSFLERDPFRLKQFYVEEFERLSGRTLYPAQPEMFTIEILAYAASIFSEAGQTAFLQNRAIWLKVRTLMKSEPMFRPIVCPRNQRQRLFVSSSMALLLSH